MKQNEKRILLIEFISLFCLLLNIFVKNILNEFTLFIFLLIMFIISIMIIGFEKEKILEEKIIIKIEIFYLITFLILIYGLGLVVGFLSTSYSLTVVNILRNSVPILFILIIGELYRYNICRKGENSKIILLISIVLFTLIDISLIIKTYDLTNSSQILKLCTLVMFPSLFKNIMLSNFAKKYGYKTCLIYQLVMGLYIYIMPIFPNLGEYLESIIMSIFPIVLMILINMQFEKEKKEDVRNKHIIKKIFNTIAIIIVVIIVCLFSNLFPFWIAVIGSGSMTPTINIGDVIIIDKRYQENLHKLKEKDIIVFNMSNSLYTHRIVEIKKENDNYYITTKGDRKGNSIDNWTVQNDDIVGVVKFKIPWIGYPTVWLNRILKER